MKVIIKQPPWAVHKVWEVAGTRPGIHITTDMESLSGEAAVLLLFSMQEPRWWMTPLLPTRAPQAHTRLAVPTYP